MTEKIYDIFDFTDVSDSGFVVVPEGTYPAQLEITTVRIKQETGNTIYELDFMLLSGDHKGQTVRYFHTVNSEDPANARRYFYRLLKTLGILRDDDRGADGILSAKAQYASKPDGTGRRRVSAIVINGEARELAGAKAQVVITHRASQADPEVTQHWVSRVTPAKDVEPLIAPTLRRKPKEDTGDGAVAKEKPKLPF